MKVPYKDVVIKTLRWITLPQYFVLKNYKEKEKYQGFTSIFVVP